MMKSYPFKRQRHFFLVSAILFICNACLLDLVEVQDVEVGEINPTYAVAVGNSTLTMSRLLENASFVGSGVDLKYGENDSLIIIVYNQVLDSISFGDKLTFEEVKESYAYSINDSIIGDIDGEFIKTFAEIFDEIEKNTGNRPTLRNPFPFPVALPLGTIALDPGKNDESFQYVILENGDMKIDFTNNFGGDASFDLELLNVEPDPINGDTLIAKQSGIVLPNGSSISVILPLSGKVLTDHMRFDLVNLTVMIPVNETLEESKSITVKYEAQNVALLRASVRNKEVKQDSTFNLPISLEGRTLKEAIIAEGLMNIDLESQLRRPHKINIVFETMFDKNGDTLVIPLSMDPSRGTSFERESIIQQMEGAKLTVVEDSIIRIRLSFVAEARDGYFMLEKGDGVNFNLGIKDLKAKSIEGYFGKEEYAIQENVDTKGMIDLPIEGNVTVPNIFGKIIIDNGSGVPLQVDFNDLSMSKSTGKSENINLSKSSLRINASEVGSSVRDSLSANLSNFISFKPDFVSVDAKATMNPLSTDVNNIITNEDTLKFELEMEVPMELSIENMAFVDTVDANMSFDLDSGMVFQSGSVRLFVLNQLPLGMDIQISLLDEGNNLLGNLITQTDGQGTIPAPVTDAEGKVVTPDQGNTVDIEISQNQFDMLSNAKFMEIKTFVNTSKNESGNQEPVKFYANSSLAIGVGVKVTLKADLDSFITN